ncbi:MAG: ABC transporter ATP-binding protein [Actinomycetes bacterium]
MSTVAIEVEDLHKSYGENEAVRGISFKVERGEVFGLLGPNGAGKTTTVEILEGYRNRTAGKAEVLGMDPGGRPRPLRERVGIVLQSSALYRNLTVREALSHFGSLYSHPRDTDETIALVGLEGKEDARSRTLSGGQQRRLDLALALIGDPELVFLDEPTTGFDPQARRAAWETIRSLRSLGTTVVLTTHYLDEAQALADRVAIIKDGRIVAEGKPGEIGGGGAHRVRVTWTAADGTPQERETDDPTRLLHELTSAAIAEGGRLENLRVGRPSLEDVYLDLTAEAEAAPETDASPSGGRRGRGGRHG